MNEQIIRQACKQLLQNADLVYVSTMDDHNYPQTRAMSNLRNHEQFNRLANFFDDQQDEFITYLTTNRMSLKMEHIGKNHKVCLYYSNYAETHGLALTGKMEIIDDMEIRKLLWQKEWIQFYEGGLEGSDYTVLCVKPLVARGWYKTDKYEFKLN